MRLASVTKKACHIFNVQSYNYCCHATITGSSSAVGISFLSTVFYVELLTCSVWTFYNSLDEPETED